VLGHMSKREIARSEGRETGANLATAGLVIGYIGAAIMIIYLLIYVAALANG
jgi:tetrahydromethanopterin S-methyltransferase subunit F